MNTFKLSAENIDVIQSFISEIFGVTWDGLTTPIMLNETDCLVFVNNNGKVPNEINTETGEVISYLDGFHFDILTTLELEIPEVITRHYPTNPKHQFA